MIILDENSVRKVTHLLYAQDAQRVFGSDGLTKLTQFVNSIREFFSVVPPDAFTASFMFICPVRDNYSTPNPKNLKLIASDVYYSRLSIYRNHVESSSVLLVEVSNSGLFNLYTVDELPPPDHFSDNSLIFINERIGERFVIGDSSCQLPIFSVGARSNFATPTLTDLSEALNKYQQEASHVTCYILADVWVDGKDGPRLVFSNKPESTMRRSLERFLSTRLADASVRPEHNTDETKPVDLIVNWFGSSLRALIEIKWIGLSLTKNSDGTQFTQYSDSRVQDGSDQLVDYIDREKRSEPHATVRGYIVVFDGRRRGVKTPATRLNRDNALYYKNLEIELTRDYSLERADIAPVIRYFLEPKESFFISSPA